MVEQVLVHFEKDMNYKGSVASMLDSVKNAFIGRVHYPHIHFIEKGIHSISFVTHGSSKDRSTAAEVDRAKELVWFLEKAVRMNDQLEESLHAGFYFYILTSPSKFISNSVFIWPLAFIILGFSAPEILNYATHEDLKEAKRKQGG